MAAQKKQRPQDITSAERTRRIQEVHELILSGSSRSQIMQYCATKFKAHQRAIDTYIAESKAIMIENFQKATDIDGFKAEIYNRLEDLYQRNLEIEDFKACQTVLKDIREMIGLNAPAKIEQTNLTMTPSEREEMLAKLKDRLSK